MSYSAPIDEKKLIENLQDPAMAAQAFDALMRTYGEQIYWQIRKMVVSHEDADDLLQNTFLKAWNNIEMFRAEARLSTWLYRIARNTAFDHLSKHDREKSYMPMTSINENTAELKELTATTHNPEDDIINQQEYDKWLTNIEKLKDDYKVVAKMNLIDNFGYKEIADALDMPINTVKTKIRRAKAQLLKMMEYSDELL